MSRISRHWPDPESVTRMAKHQGVRVPGTVKVTEADGSEVPPLTARTNRRPHSGAGGGHVGGVDAGADNAALQEQGGRGW